MSTTPASTRTARRTVRSTAASAVLPLIGAFALVACSGTASVDQADVEAEAATQLAEAVGSDTEPDIACPGDLTAEVGETLVCELSVEGDSEVYEVTIEVTEVDGDDVAFDVEVADEPISGS